jgi:hypothetical protein
MKISQAIITTVCLALTGIAHAAPNVRVPIPPVSQSTPQ